MWRRLPLKGFDSFDFRDEVLQAFENLFHRRSFLKPHEHQVLELSSHGCSTLELKGPSLLIYTHTHTYQDITLDWMSLFKSTDTAHVSFLFSADSNTIKELLSLSPIFLDSISCSISEKADHQIGLRPTTSTSTCLDLFFFF